MTNRQPIQKQEKDTLTLFLSGIAKFGKAHLRGIVTAVVILALLATLAIVDAEHKKKVKENSWAAYYKAQLAVAQDPAAVAQLDEVTGKFAGTQAAQYAQLLKGDVLYAGENYAQAADAYEPLLNAKNQTVRTVATLSLGATRQAMQDYDGAIKLMTAFIQNNPTSFALPQAYFTLAMSQELAGKTAEATETYKQILANYTKTYFGTVAKDKLAALNK